MNKNNWNEIEKMTPEMRKNLVMKMNEINKDYQFGLNSERALFGFKYAYLKETDVRQTANQALKELNYI